MKDLSNKEVIHVRKEGIEYLQFRRLLEYKEILNHAYAIGIDKNFRTTKPVDDETKLKMEEAEKNYKQLCDALESNYINLVKPNQAHTKKVLKVENKINKEKPDFNLEEYNNTDGLITNKKNIIISTTNADCILLLFFDPTKKVIANVHSGWKGTLQRISVETIKNMETEYKCNPKDIICCICPSIRACHFTVHKDVQELYYNEFKNLEDIDSLIVQTQEDEWSIDTVEINKKILQKQGLQEENMIDCGICSVCNSDLMHSYRVEKEGYGLNTAIIELK